MLEGLKNFGKKVRGMFGEDKSHTRQERGNPSGAEQTRDNRNTEIIHMTPGFDEVSGLPVLVEQPKTQTETRLQRINPNDKAIALKGHNLPAKRDPNALQEHRQVLYARPINGSQRQIEGGGRKLIGPGEPGADLPAVEQFKKQDHRVVIADITSIVDRYARTLAEKKVSERINNSGLLKKSWVRLSEAGYVEKYYQEAKAEILKNRNLLSDIQTRLMHKSEGKALRADADDVHNEILDKVISTFVDADLLDKKTRGQEVKAEHVDLGAAQNARLDSEAARLITDYALGNITDQKTFDTQVEQRLVPILEGAGAKQGKDRMYTSSLFEMAKGYKHQMQEKLNCVGKEFGPEQKAYVERFIKGTLHLDVKLGEKAADLYQARPEGVMKWYEKSVDWLQKGAILSPDNAIGALMSRITGGKDNQAAVGRVAGKFFANPVLYAAIGNVAGRGAAKALGGAAAVGLGVLGGVALMPATLAIIGSGIGAGLYLGARAAREKRRDIARREQEVVMGLRNKETRDVEMHDVVQAEKLIEELKKLQVADKLLSNEEKKMVGQIQARLDLQAQHGVDLIGVSKETSERYGGKLPAEVDLRQTLKDFWRSKGSQYGNTPAEQLAAYNRFLGDAERELIPQIEKVDKEKAETIRKYRNSVALKGACISMAAAALGPLAYKGLKLGSNFALGTHFDVSKVSYPEQAFNWYKEKFLGFPHEGAYAGILNKLPIPGSNVALNLAPGYGWANHIVDAHGNHVVDLVDPHGHLIPGGNHITFDSAGNLTNPHGLDALKAAGYQITETHGSLGHGGTGAYSEAELRADGFDHNPRADWHHIKDFDSPSKIIFNGKELQAYKHVLANGNENWDVKKMLNNLSDNAEMEHIRGSDFGIDTEGNVDTQLQELRDQMARWFSDAHDGIIAKGGTEADALLAGKAEIAKHMVLRVVDSSGLSKVVGNFDSNGHLDLLEKYANAPFKEVALVDDSGAHHILATEVTGKELLKTIPTGGKLGMVDMRPPLENGAPFILAGARRETDAMADKAKKDEEEKKKAKDEKDKKKHGGKDHGGHDHSHGGDHGHDHGDEKERMAHAFEEIQGKLDKNEITQDEIVATAKKYNLNPIYLFTKALEYKSVDHKKHEADIKAASKKHGVKFTENQVSGSMLRAAQGEIVKPNSDDEIIDENVQQLIRMEQEELGQMADEKIKAEALTNKKAKKGGVKKKPGTKDGNKPAGEKPVTDKSKAKAGGEGKRNIRENEASKKSEKQAFMNIKDRVEEFSRHKVHFTYSANESFDREKVTTAVAFAKALEELPNSVRQNALNKVNRSRSGKLEKGLILSFDGVGGQPRFGKEDKIVIPLGTSKEDIKRFLVDKFERDKNAGPIRKKGNSKQQNNRPERRNSSQAKVA